MIPRAENSQLVRVLEIYNRHDFKQQKLINNALGYLLYSRRKIAFKYPMTKTWTLFSKHKQVIGQSKILFNNKMRRKVPLKTVSIKHLKVCNRYHKKQLGIFSSERNLFASSDHFKSSPKNRYR